MSFINGRLFEEDGELSALDGSGGVPAGSFFYEGWAADEDGKPYVEDLGAVAVPATAHFPNGVGIAFNEDGCMYVTTDAPAAADKFISGMAVRQDGALRVNESGVAAGDALIGGWAVAQTGAARMAIN